MFKQAILAFTAFMAMSSPADAQQSINPPLYVVRDADSTMYLYGTVHIRPRGADWGNDRVRAAITESQEVWTEIEISPAADAQAQQLAMQLGAAAPGRPLSSWLSAEENAQLAAALTGMGIPAAALEGQEPWIAALTLSVVPMMQAGFDPTSGVDRQVDVFAETGGKTMRSFETIEQQLGFFDNMAPEAQREMLREAIVQAPAAAAMITQLSNAWETGDEAALTTLVIEETRAQYPELYDLIFVQRNNAWMQVIANELNGSGVDFVAVGAGHLLGAEGLVAQLRARGYTVERVN
ncbi:TraB/GumN family protein [Vitreimonas flagellata]|uniref:TraB/GumN family protein n=1 Tax=Vitreimonas flagellata TaxID=2560861 RepID=UPI001431605E|nr:TraB/GumN family protein [Vitreimonas flagellata]